MPEVNPICKLCCYYHPERQERPCSALSGGKLISPDRDHCCIFTQASPWELRVRAQRVRFREIELAREAAGKGKEGHTNAEQDHP